MGQRDEHIHMSGGKADDASFCSRTPCEKSIEGVGMTCFHPVLSVRLLLCVLFMG